MPTPTSHTQLTHPAHIEHTTTLTHKTTQYTHTHYLTKTLKPTPNTHPEKHISQPCRRKLPPAPTVTRNTSQKSPDQRDLPATSPATPPPELPNKPKINSCSRLQTNNLTYNSTTPKIPLHQHYTHNPHNSEPDFNHPGTNQTPKASPQDIKSPHRMQPSTGMDDQYTAFRHQVQAQPPIQPISH